MAEESAGARVAQDLRERLRTGAILPGTALSQGDLAAAYGVSRIPVRDALQLLQTEGLIQLGASGAVATGLSIGELQELYELREAVEPMVTALGVPGIGRAETARMARELELMQRPGTSPAEWLESNTRFHALVYGRAPRPRMIALTEQLRRLTDRYLYLHLDVIGREEHLHEEHRRILDAVHSGDPHQVAELTRVHLATSHEFILRYLLETADAPAPRAGSARR